MDCTDEEWRTAAAAFLMRVRASEAELNMFRPIIDANDQLAFYRLLLRKANGSHE